ncbi:MAG TPA: hypothetical protein VIY54_05980 [Steroidobacteraceae bacterium]
MKYLVIALLAVLLGGLIGRSIWGERPAAATDPVQVIVTQLRTHALIEHERQLAIWYRACPSVWGKTPELFIAWPAKLSYQLELGDVQVTKHDGVITVHTGAIQPNEPSVPSDFVDSLSTSSIFTFANEQELVNRETAKASPIARYLTSYFLARDPSLQGDFANELRRLVEHLASALGVPFTRVDVEVPKPQVTWPKLPKIELCEGTAASVNGLPFAKFVDNATVPIGFRPAGAANGSAGAEVPKGTASVFNGQPRPAR